jgi:ABC-2 type transport system permease protein
MRAGFALFRRELAGYFTTPIAAIFIIVFLVLAGALPIYAGDFFGRGEADLEPFFAFLPWLYLLLAPALAMRLWAEEARSGTIELLFTLPIGPAASVLAKFLAGWAVLALALALTFPMWLTVAWLGAPDHRVIAAGYGGSLLVAGLDLAAAACASAMTRNQVVAFILGVVLCLIVTVPGAPALMGLLGDRLPAAIVDAISVFGIVPHFRAIARGVVDLRDLVFFVTVGAFFLFAATVALDLRRAG